MRLPSPAGQDLAPAHSAEEVARRVGEAWDLSGAVPMPRFVVECPVCRSEEVQLRQVSFGRRKSSPISGRSDVSFKCCACSATWTHGVPVPDAFWRSGVERFGGNTAYWREIVAASGDGGG